MENKHHNHIDSLYMRESLLDKKVMAIGEGSSTFKMLPYVHIVKMLLCAIVVGV